MKNLLTRSVLRRVTTWRTQLLLELLKSLCQLFILQSTTVMLVLASLPQFRHTTSSPHFPSSNGQAERAVKQVKHLLKRADDPFLALLSYRSTPMPWYGKSPAELLMGRNIRANLPHTTDSLTPQWPYLEDFRRTNKEFKEKQKKDYDRHHRTKELREIPDNTTVWITTGKQPVPGKVLYPADTPRSYIVQTPSGNVRRNRSQLNVQPPSTPTSPTTPPGTRSTVVPQASRSPIMTRSRSGTSIQPPKRLS